MAGKPYKAHKKGGGRHVQLHEWVQSSEAWASLKSGPRALYIELKRRYNGHNNGELVFSHRDAALALNAHRNTIGPWFEELRERGLIEMTQAPHLGPSGVGKSSIWSLQELPAADGSPAKKEFLLWRKNKIPAQ